VLVIYQTARIPALGMDNHRVVSLFASEGLLFTLSLSFARVAYDPALVRPVLASLRMPPGL